MEQKFTTMSYDELKNIKTYKANRKINTKHVKELEKQMMKHMDIFPPITVNKKAMVCIDGNHRLNAFRNLYEQGKIDKDTTYPVMYVTINKDKQRNTIISANTNSKNWTIDNYITNSINEGDKDIVAFNEFAKSQRLFNDDSKKELKYNPRYAMACTFGKNMSNQIKKGTFTFTDNDKRFAIRNIREIEMLTNKLSYEKNSWRESFSIAWTDLRKNNMELSTLVDRMGIEAVSSIVAKHQLEWGVVTKTSVWKERFESVLRNEVKELMNIIA